MTQTAIDKDGNIHTPDGTWVFDYDSEGNKRGVGWVGNPTTTPWVKPTTSWNPLEKIPKPLQPPPSNDVTKKQDTNLLPFMKTFMNAANVGLEILNNYKAVKQITENAIEMYNNLPPKDALMYAYHNKISLEQAKKDLNSEKHANYMYSKKLEFLRKAYNNWKNKHDTTEITWPIRSIHDLALSPTEEEEFIKFFEEGGKWTYRNEKNKTNWQNPLLILANPPKSTVKPGLLHSFTGINHRINSLSRIKTRAKTRYKYRYKKKYNHQNNCCCCCCC